jgi:hypothetical protein
LQSAPDLALIGEEAAGVGHRQVEHVGDALAAVLHLEHLGLISAAAAGGAHQQHVREELHLDLFEAVAATGLAAAAVDVEREGGGGVAAQPGLVGGGEQPPHRIEDLGVGGRVGARRRADRALVDEDDLGQLVGALDVVAFAGRGRRLAAAAQQAAIEDVLDQGALA